MGSPQNPSDTQIAELEKAVQLQVLTSPVWIKTENGKAVLEFGILRQGVSLLKLTW